MFYRNLSTTIRHLLTISILTLLPVIVEAQSLSNNYSDIKPGSILFFNRFTSNPVNQLLGDTQVNITNLNQSRAIELHFYLIDGSSCSVADFGSSLNASQTMTFLMSDFDPGIFGYMIVVAEDESGLPTQHNWLTGTAQVREFDGRQGILSAISIGKLTAGPITADPDGQYRLKFNGASYEKLPQVLAVPSFDSQVTTTSFLYIYSPSSNIYTGDTNSITLSTLLYNDASQSLSGSFTITCYRQDSFMTVFNRGGGINNRVPAGRTGWIRMASSSAPILGSVITRNSLFQGGYNLPAVSLYGSYEILVPNF
ncbi:MAG: hypothetical protein RIR86_2435 [Acidobacteriota bacterium]|jgi:hypothetical protein